MGLTSYKRIPTALTALEKRIVRELETWKADPYGKACPNHENEWAVIRLLRVADKHDSIGTFTATQIKLITSCVNLDVDAVIQRIASMPPARRPRHTKYAA